MGEKTIPFKTSEGIHRNIKVGSANVVKPLVSMRRVVHAGNVVVLDENNSHLRNTRDGATLKLDETGPVFRQWWQCTASVHHQ